MRDCLVTRVDGQGLLLEGYHRAAVVLENEFEWIGSHAMVAWGSTSSCLDAECERVVPNGGDGPGEWAPTVVIDLDPYIN
jgi:hypothetical protein